jgi:para-nitrobenzyl esterase
MKQTATMAGASAALAAAGCAPSEPASRQPATPIGTGEVATPDAAVVATTGGRIRGFTRNSVFVFKGVPYGDTTAGANRFLPPKPVQPWTDVRPTLAWGPVSPQPQAPFPDNQEQRFLNRSDDGFAGEDMLRLNVWTPAMSSGRRPVLVWIHGGAYTWGSSQKVQACDGERLAREHDVVVVSMNHRLNIFGFLDLSQLGGERYAQSGNAGMLDLVQALQWVCDNITNFGGDPGNVTIFGQSGGGQKVTTLMAMPTAQGLFHKAVAISGSFIAASTGDKATQLATLVMKELGLQSSQVDRLHAASTDALLNAGLAAQQKQTPFRVPAPGTPPVASLGWQPVVDGTILPDVPFDPAAPATSASVPFLAGSTFHELTTGINQPGAHLLTWDQIAEQLTPQLGPRAAGAIHAYRAVFPAAKPFEIRGLIGADVFRRGAVMQAERKAAQAGAPVYQYWFGWKTPVLDGRPLAYHGQDLAFWFDNVDLCLQSTGGGENARRLASRMSRALVAFARTGNPNHQGIPEWQPFTEVNRATMIFDTTTEATMDPDGEARDVLAQG